MPKWLKTDVDNLRTKFLALNVHFNHLSSHLLGSKSSVRKPQILVLLQEALLFYCTLYMIAQEARPLPLRVT